MAKFRVFREPVVQPQDQSYKIIRLTQGQVTLVDASDYDWLMQWNWQAAGKEGKLYAVRAYGYQKVYMHREIVHCESEHLDHWNNDTLDNRRINLRPATPGQNGANRKKQRDNTSGYKGVSWHKMRNRWCASAKVNGIRIHIGYYLTKEEAYAAYCTFARETWGEFANFG